MKTLAPFIEPIGWMLVHFLWQGLLVAAVLKFALWLMRGAGARWRHAAAVVALLAMVAVAAGTLVRLWPEARNASTMREAASLRTAEVVHAPVSDAAAKGVAGAVVGRAPAWSVKSISSETSNAKVPLTPRVLAMVDRALPFLVALWAGGVVFFSQRLARGWLRARGWVRCGLPPAAGQWAERLEGLRERLRVSAPVRLLSSTLVAVPAVVGWLRPVVLVPASLFTTLSAAELEAILAHELAHIRRHDYAVNLLQCAVETLFFYHPAVWWVSARLRQEREHCCDDLAAAACGGALPYARALALLEELRVVEAGTPALAANGGSLLQRIRRLAGVPEPRVAVNFWPWLAAVLVLVVGLAVGVGMAGAGEKKEAAPAAAGGQTAAQAPVTPEAERLMIEQLSKAPKVQGACSGVVFIDAAGKLEWAASDDPKAVRKAVTIDELVAELKAAPQAGVVRIRAAKAAAYEKVLAVVKNLNAGGMQRLSMEKVEKLQIRAVEKVATNDTEFLESPSGGAWINVNRQRLFTEDDIAEASVTGEEKDGTLAVRAKLKPAAAQLMREWTKAHLHEQMAIFVDGRLVMAPTIQSELGEELQISGRFSRAEAEVLVAGLHGKETMAPAPRADDEAVYEQALKYRLNGEESTGVVFIGKTGGITWRPVGTPHEERKTVSLEGLFAETQPGGRVLSVRAVRSAPHERVVAVVAELVNKHCRPLPLEIVDESGGESPAQAPKQPAGQPDSTPAAGKGASSERPKNEGANSLELEVLDATTLKSVPAFRVITGVPSQAGDSKPGIVNWQPHTLAEGKDGKWSRSLERAYDEMALRVEAEGMAPEVVKGLKKKERLHPEKPWQFQVLLQKAEPETHQFFLPDGKPAAGATVALAMVQRDAVLDGGKLRHAGEAAPAGASDAWRWPRIFTADEQGGVRLPAEEDPTAAVLVIHEAGVKEISLVELKLDGVKRSATGGALLVTSETTLQPWARVEGRVIWGKTPGANQAVSLTIHRDRYGYPGVIAQYERTTTDAKGNFVFEKVLPGQVQLSCPFKPEGGKSGITEVNMTGQIAHVVLKPGVNRAVIGGKGRKVTGRLTGRDSWDGVTLSMAPSAPHIGMPGDEAMWAAYAKQREGPAGALLFQNGIPVRSDGTFEIPQVLPGHYQLFFSKKGEPVNVGYSSFTAEAETDGETQPPLALPEIKAK